MVKGFKLKRDIVEEFEAVCAETGISQAAWLTEKIKRKYLRHKRNAISENAYVQLIISGKYDEVEDEYYTKKH